MEDAKEDHNHSDSYCSRLVQRMCRGARRQ